MDIERAESDVRALPTADGTCLHRPRTEGQRMTRTRAIELIQRILKANADGVPLEGREMLEATFALGYAVEVLLHHTPEAVFDRAVSDLAPWLT